MDDNRKKHVMECPHCKAVLTLKEVITILNGSGFRQMAPVQLEDGQVAYMEAGLVNPNAVEILA
jgi:hypothetical protein